MSDADDWGAQFREYAAACRVMHPLPPRESLSMAEEHQCRTIGGTILTWLGQHGPQFLQQRAAMADALGVDPDPVIVFSSDAAGCVAAQQILGDHRERVVFMQPSDYAALLDADSAYKHHLHFWSYFRPELDPQVAVEALATHPLAAGCTYWQHSEGTMWAPNAGRGGEHLWQWDGREPKLLREAISQWIA